MFYSATLTKLNMVRGVMLYLPVGITHGVITIEVVCSSLRLAPKPPFENRNIAGLRWRELGGLPTFNLFSIDRQEFLLLGIDPQ